MGVLAKVISIGEGVTDDCGGDEGAIDVVVA
jgi:hypothetical protein